MSIRKLATKPRTKAGSSAAAGIVPRELRDAREGSSSRPTGRTLGRSLHRSLTSYIEISCARDVYAALSHAIHIGHTPNRHMTINWQAAGVTDSIAATGRLMKLIRDWAASRDYITYIWVRECGEVVGEHVHILFHLPTSLSRRFPQRKAGWLRLCGATRKKGISKTNVIHGSRAMAKDDPWGRNLYAHNLLALTKYVLKHCSPDVQRSLGIARKGPCPLSGKRVSISQNLHRAARSRCAECISESGMAAT